jgi:alkaline phosphatase D
MGRCVASHSSPSKPQNDLIHLGYTSNRNRTLHHLYSNAISNTAFLAGDSHANWVSDLVWLDETPYNQVTGEGAIGVEFAGTAVSSTGYGSGRSIANSSDRSAALVRDNRELQWTEGYYRGYYELYISPEELTARYYGMLFFLLLGTFWKADLGVGSPSVATRNPFEVSLANFTVKAGANHLQRNVAGGSVESGALQRGNTVPTNLTLNTQTGTWNVTGFSQMFITYPAANASASG